MLKLSRYLTIVALALSSFAFADDEERAQVQSRQMSEETATIVENENNENEEVKKESSYSFSSPAEEQVHAGYFWDSPNLYYPPASHWISELSALSDTLVMEDGSIWHINSSDRNTLSWWKVSDPIVVTQSGWFSSYKFKIVNKSTNTSVDASLSLGPLLGGQYTHKIVGIDYGRGEILLANGSRWNISYNDRTLLNEWLLNDTIIVGINTRWFSSGEFILIDVEMNNHIKANLIQ
jgi:hypothetical protein